MFSRTGEWTIQYICWVLYALRVVGWSIKLFVTFHVVDVHAMLAVSFSLLHTTLLHFNSQQEQQHQPKQCGRKPDPVAARPAHHYQP